MKWVTLHQSLKRENCAVKNSILANSKVGVFGTSRQKPASWRQIRRKDLLVATETKQDGFSYEFQFLFVSLMK